MQTPSPLAATNKTFTSQAPENKLQRQTSACRFDKLSRLDCKRAIRATYGSSAWKTAHTFVSQDSATRTKTNTDLSNREVYTLRRRQPDTVKHTHEILSEMFRRSRKETHWSGLGEGGAELPSPPTESSTTNTMSPAGTWGRQEIYTCYGNATPVPVSSTGG